MWSTFKVAVRPAVHLLCGLPLFYWCWIVWRTINGERTLLSTDPGQILADQTGLWAFNLLIISLLFTPLSKWFGLRWVGYRRAVGLWAFAYAVIHVLVFYWLILGANLSSFGRELVQRPYIVLGAGALSLLLLLAATSNQFSMRRLKKRWKELHQWVYLAVMLVAIHALWQIKGDWGWPILQALVVVLLLGVRLWWYLQRRLSAAK